ncbi:MAG: glycosyltransferase [Candidatus Shapirobacteria bacterium]|nr:glycosyltransferase [Candidatus Shapirobacteria bacterium]MDD4410482.1 glycosyltransferase [Candidatus Shapirobacteria bacterium]
MNKPKVALFYDWLNQWGGAEKVLLDLIKLYPKAPIFTIIYDPKKTDWLPKKVKIIPSFLNKLSPSKKNNILHTPLYSTAVRNFDFSKFDIVISTSSTIGHHLSVPSKTLFICYLHNVNRHIYQQKYSWPLSYLISKYKQKDKIYAQKPNYFFCNSKTVQKRIADIYKRKAKIIYPGIDTSFFIPSKTKPKEKYFLIVSRLVKYKRIDIAIKACQKLNFKLKIVGVGRDCKTLKKIVKPNSNIEFIGKIDDKKLLNLYQNCQALICPQLEDFGLTPIEAQACGKPVIAYNKGGLTETVINNKTGIFFNHQTVKSLILAIKKFNPKNFSKDICRKNSQNFSSQNFMLNFKKEIDLLWQNHQ